MNMPIKHTFSIVIQAGGQSSRMGQDKALMPFLGQPLVERLARRLAGASDELLVTTNRPQGYGFLGLPLVPDVIAGQGALGGLYTALWAAHSDCVAVVACDMPFVLPALLQAQRALLESEGVDVVIPRSLEGLEPLHAVYRREVCLPVVKAALRDGERKMISWFPKVRVREMTPEEVAVIDPAFHSFFNVNDPAEFQAAEALARSIEP